MHDKTHLAAVDDLFALARTAPAPVSDRLMRAVIADAEREVARPRTSATGARRSGWFAGLAQAIGGWPALGGLAMTALAGLWIGLAPPVALQSLAVVVWGETVTVALDPLDDLAGLEG